MERERDAARRRQEKREANETRNAVIVQVSAGFSVVNAIGTQLRLDAVAENVGNPVIKHQI